MKNLRDYKHENIRKKNIHYKITKRVKYIKNVVTCTKQ